MIEHPTKASVIDEAALQSFAAQLRGPLIQPGDASYDEARKVFNGMIDRYPQLIVRCVDVAGVIASVNFAREQGLTLSVRGGGHNVAGFAVNDGGLVVDLSAMKGIAVDPARRTVVAQPGLTLGELDRATQEYGLAVPLGIVSMTGIAGLTLGGGIGWLNGKHGLACDNLLAAEVVTADGRLLTVSTAEHDDLFWGLRGGGGNFGVVTSFTYQLHPVGPVLGGGVMYPPARACEALRFYQEFAGACPDELTTMASVGADPDGRPVVAVAVCYCGPLAAGERAVRPLRAFGPLVADDIQLIAYCALQSRADAGFPLGRQHYWKGGRLAHLDDEAIETLLDLVAKDPPPPYGIGLQQVHGVASRVDPAATAFPHRGQWYDFLVLAQWADPALSVQNIERTRAFFAAMQPFLEGGVYVNNLGTAEDDRVRAAYGGNYERLLALKNRYDPTNLFHMNQNIRIQRLEGSPAPTP
jgi:FAD/FMN-containing dehydrogenase